MYMWTIFMQLSHPHGLIHIIGIIAGRRLFTQDGAGDMIRLHGDLLHGDLAGTPGGDQAWATIRDGATAGIRVEYAVAGIRAVAGTLAVVGIRVVDITIMVDTTIQLINTQTAEDRLIHMQEAELMAAHTTDLTAIQEEELREATAQANLHQVRATAA